MVSYSESDSLQKKFSSDFIRNLYSLYKIPLIFTVIGGLLIISGILFLTKATREEDEVVFQTQPVQSAKKIMIDVEGSVQKPGVYTLLEGDRIRDALIQAGGLSQQADREWVAQNLNQAKNLTDGGKIYIPSIGETTAGKTQSSNVKTQSDGNNLLGVTTGLININSASQSELEALPGVGPVTAQKIINNRPYGSVSELKTKKILNNPLYEKLKDLLTAF